MTLTRTAPTDCTSTSLIGTSQVNVDIPTRPEPTRTELYDQFFDGLSRLGHDPKQVEIVMGLLKDLGKAVAARKSMGRVDKSRRGIYRIAMNMAAHDALDAVMQDKARAQAGTLHDIANRAFLPDNMTFVHDKTIYCVVEARRK